MVNFHVLKVNAPPSSRRDLVPDQVEFPSHPQGRSPKGEAALASSQPDASGAESIGPWFQSDRGRRAARRSTVPTLACAKPHRRSFLDSPQIPYPAKIRRVRGTEHVRASGPGAVTIGLQYVQIERSASRSGPCTTSIPLTRCPGSIAASWELVADAPAVTDSATRTMETNHRRTPNILSRRVLR